MILQSLSPVSHVNNSLGWIVPPNNSDNTGRAHFPVSLTEVTISIQYTLALASLSKGPSAVVVPVISDIPPLFLMAKCIKSGSKQSFENQVCVVTQCQKPQHLFSISWGIIWHNPHLHHGIVARRWSRIWCPCIRTARKISRGTRGGGNITFIHDQKPLHKVHASHTPSQPSDAELSHHGLIKCLYKLLEEYTKTIEFSYYLTKEQKGLPFVSHIPSFS